MTVYDTLLEVQGHDTAIEQLLHRRATLPERAELAALEANAAELDRRREEVCGRRDEIGRRQDEVEREVDHLSARIAEIDKRLYSGTVSASRELQAMSAEADHLRERKSELEDHVLEAMEEREPIDAEVAAIDGQREEVDATAARLRASLAEAESGLDVDVEAERVARQRSAASVPGELLDRYERLRAKLGGVGAAKLAGASCTGCHLTLPASELARIHREPPDALVLCDHCGRILVR